LLGVEEGQAGNVFCQSPALFASPDDGTFTPFLGANKRKNDDKKGRREEKGNERNEKETKENEQEKHQEFVRLPSSSLNLTLLSAFCRRWHFVMGLSQRGMAFKPMRSCGMRGMGPRGC
jgi:hypothetical protein